MSDSEHTLSVVLPLEPRHPRCQVCAVPMWLVTVQHFSDGHPEKDRLHYECKACEAKAIIPALR